MYADFKDLGILNRDVAGVLLDTQRSFGGVLVADRIASRTQLSRYIVHVAPGETGGYPFRDFAESSQSLLTLVGKAQGRLSAAQRSEFVLQRYMGQAADRALLALMLFVATGCTGDPHEAARCTDRFANERIGAAFRTTEARVDLQTGDTGDGAEGELLLGLMRIVDGKLTGAKGFHRLSPTTEGTEIGSLASGADAITDVDGDVSRHHARVYREDGRWYVVGLKSTNGTTVISGEDKVERTVEPPKRERPRGYTPQPVEILPTDTLCLGVSTRYMVMPVLG